jgi:K+-sensing histidine kinase KdpD
MTNTHTGGLLQVVCLESRIFRYLHMKDEILCTIDFSDASKKALKWSIDLANRLQSHLTILYTYRLNKQTETAITMKKKMEEEARSNFRDLERELLLGTNLVYDFKAEVGFVADRVEEHAKNRKIGFLVMSKGTSNGSQETFDELMEHLKIPLIIIP